MYVFCQSFNVLPDLLCKGIFGVLTIIIERIEYDDVIVESCALGIRMFLVKSIKMEICLNKVCLFDCHIGEVVGDFYPIFFRSKQFVVLEIVD